MNKHFKFILASAAIVAGLAGAVSCQDLKGELETLTNKVNALDSQVATLQQAINAGKLITSVESFTTPAPGGIKVNFSDNSSQTIMNGKDGANGKDGNDGAAADVWTIEDGYWAKNGVPTEWKAVGTDGKDGKDGNDGTNGTNGNDGKDGKDGCWYVPNAETGCFDKYTPNADGEPTVEPTDISFVPAIEGIVAGVYDETLGKLLIAIDGNIYALDAFAELKSLVTIPDAYLEGIEAVKYKQMTYQPLVWGNAKNHVNATISDEYMVGETTTAGAAVIKDINPLMTVQYYVNPENADLSAITLADLNVKLEKNMDYIQTRADASDDLKVIPVSVSTKDANGNALKRNNHRVIEVKYRVTGDAATIDDPLTILAGGSSKVSVFALSVATGSANGQVSSDYVALYKEELNDLRIVDPTKVVGAKFAYNDAGLTPTRNYAPDDVYAAAGIKEEHYRRAIYGMNFQQAAGNVEDPDAWIVNRTTEMNNDGLIGVPGSYPTAVAADVKKPNYRDADRNNVHLSADTVVVYKNREFNLLDIVAAHNWASPVAVGAGLPPIAALPTGGVCTMDELDDDDLKDLGLEWRFEVVENYYAGLNNEPITPQEKFVSLNEFGNLCVDEVEPGDEDGVLFLPRNYTIDGPSVASIGRHPVIRVSLIDANKYNENTDGSKPVIESAYIKILIVEDVPGPETADYNYDFHVLGSEGTWANPTFTQAIPITTYPNPIGFTCANGFNGTTTVQWTNENIYHDNGDKIIFHNTHVFNPLNAADPATGYVVATGIDNTLAAGDAWPGHVDFDPAHPFNAAGELVGDLGTVWEVVLPDATSGTTHIINWQISPDDIWAIASVIDEPIEVIRYCKYVGASTVTIALHVQIAPFSTIFPLDWSNNPAESDYIAQYWIAHNHDAAMAQWDATAHHVDTPAVGVDDSDYCNWKADINASFVTNDGTIAGYPDGTLRVVRDGVAVSDVAYYFHDENEVDDATFKSVRAGEDVNKVEHVYVRVSTEDLVIPANANGAGIDPYVGNYPAGQVLYAGVGVLTAAQAAMDPEDLNAALGPGNEYYFPVALITNKTYAAPSVYPFNTLAYMNVEADNATRNELALDLLNTDGFYAYLGATGKICSAADPSQHDAFITFHGEEYFKVDFLRPVSIDPAATKHFVDAVDFGNEGSYIRYEDIVSPYDWRMVWNNNAAAIDTHFNLPANVTYYGYYGIEDAMGAGADGFIIHADIPNAKCNLGGTNKPIPATIVLQANELNNDANYMPATWVGMTPEVDADWYTDLQDASAPQAANGTVYSYNRSTNTALSYDLTAADIAAGKGSDYGWLTYNNNNVAVGAFELKVPMIVFYKWGKLTTVVTIKVATTI